MSPEFHQTNDLFARESEWVLFSDESIQKGQHYSNFFGGVLVRASQILRINRRLEEILSRHGIESEVKWNKVTEQWLNGYEALVNAFFDEVFAGNLRVRIMFRQNSWIGPGLTPEQKEKGYFLLYYQFVKHAFGFGRVANDHPIHLRLYFDQFPHKKTFVSEFRDYLSNLFESIGRKSGLLVRKSDITEVRSHEHPILQVLDVVLGAMAFRLNDGHKVRIEGQRGIPKRTKAKTQLYNLIYQRVSVGLGFRFNIGVSTGAGESPQRWTMPYAHWSFIPHGAVHQSGVGKNPKKEPHSDLHQGPT